MVLETPDSEEDKGDQPLANFELKNLSNNLFSYDGVKPGEETVVNDSSFKGKLAAHVSSLEDVGEPRSN